MQEIRIKEIIKMLKKLDEEKLKCALRFIYSISHD